MNIRTPKSGQSARVAMAFLKSQGLAITHSQALKLVARLHGYTDNQAMQADKRFADPLTLRAESSNEFTLYGPKQSSAWVSVENISVHIKKCDEGVSVDLFVAGQENNSLYGTWMEYAEAEEAIAEAATEAAKDPASEAVPANAPRQPENLCLTMSVAQDIRRLYLDSEGNKHDVEHALHRLNAECASLFTNPTAAWKFLINETTEDTE